MGVVIFATIVVVVIIIIIGSCLPLAQSLSSRTFCNLMEMFALVLSLMQSLVACGYGVL